MENINKLLPITNSIGFKRIFGDRNNVNILKAFLQSVIKLPAEEYEEIELLDTLPDKENIINAKVHTTSRELIEVEIKVTHLPITDREIVCRLADMMTSQVGNGIMPVRFHKVVNVVITTSHNIVGNSGNYVHRYEMADKNGTLCPVNLLEVDTLELQKLPQEDDNSEIWKWMKFLKTDSSEEIEMLSKDNTAIKAAADLLKELSKSSEL